MEYIWVLIPIVGIVFFFSAVIIAIVVPTYYKSVDRKQLQDTVRTAIAAGQPLPPEVLEALTSDVKPRLPTRQRDLRRAVIWLSITGAFLVIGFAASAADGFEDGVAPLAAAAFPGFIGLAFLIFGLMAKPEPKRIDEPKS